MKARYFPEDDLLVLRISDQPYQEAEKIGQFILHYSKEGEPVMLEILHAAKFLKETTEALPYPTVAKLLRTR